MMKFATDEKLRIGFYVCHCGGNIAGVVDVAEVARFAETLPGVAVSRHYKYMCSHPGQELIQRDIQDHGLNRVVVASCSVLLHERTFRQAVEKAGLNPFLFQMVNIREHDAWVHSDRAAATEKAKDLVRAAIRRVAFHQPLETKRVPIHGEVLVVGGGIAGIHAALVLADAGKRVYLVEREPSIGGHMSKFDKTFPTLDCAACILTPKMSAVGAHPNITLWTYSEVTKVEGYVGNFDVTVRRKPRSVIEDLCSGCLQCVEHCIYKEPKFPDEFNLGLGRRKPIYLFFPQATRPVPVIDPETCIEFKTGRCGKTCVEACGDRRAINFRQQEKSEQIHVGAIIIATGFQIFDARRTAYYGYGLFPNVYNALEVERLLNASGPTGGELVMRDGRAPKRVGIIHCVGSRDVNTNRYCSRVCCLYSLKLAHLIKEHTGAEVYNFYIDLRTPGKGMEDFYHRVAEEGMVLVRGRVGDVYPDTSDGGNGRLICQGPKDIPGTVAQAGAAAAEALALIVRGHTEQKPNMAVVVEENCSGCKSCIPLCPYTAITFDETKQKATVNAALCKGCGVCVAACPSGSIKQNLCQDDEIFGEIEGVLAA